MFAPDPFTTKSTMTALTSARETRPEASEHAPYYTRYIALVSDGDVVDKLAGQLPGTLGFLRSLDEETGGRRYAPDKWSIRQVIGHLADSERIFSYRALRFARNDPTELPGFDEGTFVANGTFDARSLASLCDEYEAVRAASVAFFSSLDANEWARRGVANNNVMSVRALAWVLAGHELHHVDIIRTRYL
jgi:hypothetical protein